MKIVAFCGSPRVKGNTRQLVEEFASHGKTVGLETEIIDVFPDKISPCTGCMGCLKNQDRKCVIKTDSLNEWVAKVTEADGVIIASPTYFANVTAEIKALVDRFGMVARCNNYLWKNKPAAPVIAVRRGGAVPAYDAVNRGFQLNRMIMLGSSYWNFGLGLRPGDVAEDKEGIENMQLLAEDFAWLIGKIKA